MPLSCRYGAHRNDTEQHPFPKCGPDVGVDLIPKMQMHLEDDRFARAALRRRNAPVALYVGINGIRTPGPPQARNRRQRWMPSSVDQTNSQCGLVDVWSTAFVSRSLSFMWTLYNRSVVARPDRSQPSSALRRSSSWTAHTGHRIRSDTICSQRVRSTGLWAMAWSRNSRCSRGACVSNSVIRPRGEPMADRRSNIDSPSDLDRTKRPIAGALIPMDRDHLKPVVCIRDTT